MGNTQKIIELMRRLRIEMNGAVSGAMRDYGTAYNLNYGVSIPTIKEIAEAYYPDHSLALDLWKQDVRELKLSAVYIDNPAEVNASQINLWAADFGIRELMEQAVMKLFYASPDAETVALEWICSDNPTLRTSGCYLIGKAVSTGSITSDPTSYIDIIISQGGDIPSTVYSLRELGRYSENAKTHIKNSIRKLSEEVAEELKWQLF